MNQYQALIDEESKIIALLKAKLAQREERLKSLVALQQAPDKIDELLYGEIRGEMRVPRTSVAATTPKSDEPKGLQNQALPSILEFVGPGKTLRQIIDFLIEKQIVQPGEDKKVRRWMWQYKNVLQVVESSQRGSYKLTRKGIDLLEGLENSAKGDAAGTAQSENDA